MKQIPENTTFYDYNKDIIDKILKDDPEIGKSQEITPENIFQLGRKEYLDYFAEIVSRVLLPGSEVKGIENLKKLYELSEKGKSCLILSRHVSNFDVPILYKLMKDASPEGEKIFDRIFFIAGKKLNEESGVSNICTSMFNRVVIAPKQNFPADMNEDEKKEILIKDLAINKSAQKKIKEMKHNKWICLIYPTATRERPWDKNTKKGIRETDNYLKSFDYFLCMSINGLTLLPQKERGMIFDFLKKDIVYYNTGEIQKSEDFRNKILDNIKDDPNIDKKQFIIDEIMKEIHRLHDEIEPERLSKLKELGF